eukprot:5082122-Pleurochrysis_carterae.AAC.2
MPEGHQACFGIVGREEINCKQVVSDGRKTVLTGTGLHARSAPRLFPPRSALGGRARTWVHVPRDALPKVDAERVLLRRDREERKRKSDATAPRGQTQRNRTLCSHALEQ